MIVALDVLSGETALGAGAFSLLTVMCVQIFRRQGEADSQHEKALEERAQVSDYAVALADERRARAEAETEAARARAEAEYERAAALSRELAAERARRGE